MVSEAQNSEGCEHVSYWNDDVDHEHCYDIDRRIIAVLNREANV